MSTNTKNFIEVREVAAPLDNVQFSTADPNLAGTVFTPNTPQDKTKLYASDINGTTWIWNGTAYVGKKYPVQNYLGMGARIYRVGNVNATAGFPSFIPYNTQDYITGTLVTSDLANNALKLTAGYIYRVSAEFYTTYVADNSVSLNFFTSTDGTTFTEYTPNRTTNFASTVVTNSNSQNYNWTYIKADVNTWVKFAIVSGTASVPLHGSGSKVQNMAAFCIGAIA